MPKNEVSSKSRLRNREENCHLKEFLLLLHLLSVCVVCLYVIVYPLPPTKETNSKLVPVNVKLNVGEGIMSYKDKQK